jgi:hypothetical protein
MKNNNPKINLSVLNPQQVNQLIAATVIKYKGQVQLLLNDGFKVEARVKRIPAEKIEFLNVLKKWYKTGVINYSTYKEKTHSLMEPVYQLRAKKEAEVQQIFSEVPHSPVEEKLTYKQEYERLMKISYIHPKGGSASIVLTHPVTGEKYIGQSICNPADSYVRKKAWINAAADLSRKLLNGRVS